MSPSSVFNMKKAALPFFILLALVHSCASFSQTASAESKSLRGTLDSSGEGDGQQQQTLLEEQIQHRNIQADVIPTILLTQSSTFQIIISALLSILIILQSLLLISFARFRNKRVLEFAQPIAICVFVACSIITTATCYLYVYVNSSVTCAIREPLVFMSVSLMGATVAGRAWRISSLLNNPLLTAGNRNGESSNVGATWVEKFRKFMLRLISGLSGCECSVVSILSLARQNSPNGGGGRPIRVQITTFQMVRATMFLLLPQLVWQIVVLSAPMLRASRELLSYNYEYNEQQIVIMEQFQCQSGSGFWPNYVSIVLTIFPYTVAFLLNIRPKSELDLLPDIIDEREQLKQSFHALARILIVVVPVIGLTFKNNPEAKAYGAVNAVLALPLACCYYIAYAKLNAIKSNKSMTKRQVQKISGGASSVVGSSEDDKAASVAMRMAEMYFRIGRVEETLQLVDETLEVFRKRNSSGSLGNLKLQNEGMEEVASGFTKSDLKLLDEDELQLIIRLLRLKGNALMKLKGDDATMMNAQLNVDAIKIFENCPAVSKMKDISVIFPIYNVVISQMKGGLINQDDKFSLEKELAVRFCREAQLQTFHYARSLANIAEMYGRLGMPDEAFYYFNIMKAIYMTQDHPKLLLDAYSVERCAVSFATSSLWYLHKGQIDDAIKRCDYVIEHILPSYDQKDILGMYFMFIHLIRVLKWNGHVDKAREAYNKYMPDAAGTHFAVGSIHKPMGLLLQICDGSSHKYDTSQMSDDIELALSFDMPDITDNNFTCDGWSMKSMAAELCMLLAARLDVGHTDRVRLINRGLLMATAAQDRVSASNGMVKHILAYDANKGIHEKLLRLASEEVRMDRDIIHNSNDKSYSLSQRKLSLELEVNSITEASSTMGHKFSVKDDTLQTSGSSAISTASTAKSKTKTRAADGTKGILIAQKKKISFSRMSSLDSFGSTARQSSNHSRESLKEYSSNHSHETPHLRESTVETKNGDEDVADVV